MNDSWVWAAERGSPVSEMGGLGGGLQQEKH